MRVTLEYVDIRQPIEHCPRMFHLYFGLGTIPMDYNLKKNNGEPDAFE
jgi:hypothetical protein